MFLVKIGSHHKSSLDAPYEFHARIRGIFVHPKFSSFPSTSYDITLLRLEDEVPFPFNNHTNVACVPETVHETVPAGTMCVVAGWGSTAGRETWLISIS